MIRETTRPVTGKCTLPMYMGYLISEPGSATCTGLSSVMGISHDSVNRFLFTENYTPKDLYEEGIKCVDPHGGTLSCDDTVLDKPYSMKMELVSYFWSGKHHRSVKGINLITLYYTDPQGHHVPVNYRIVDKAENKTKNEYFREMVKEVIAWGLRPTWTTADSWYSCNENLKTVKNHGMGFMFAIEANRTVSIEKGQWVQVQALDIPDDGIMVWLRGFGELKLFRTRLKDQLRHYVVYLPEPRIYAQFQRHDFCVLHDQHWQIEQYHRTIKQVCNIERSQVRSEHAIRNHIFAALCGFIALQKMRLDQLIINAYSWKRDLFQGVVAQFIQQFMPSIQHLNSRFKNAVNA